MKKTKQLMTLIFLNLIFIFSIEAYANTNLLKTGVYTAGGVNYQEGIPNDVLHASIESVQKIREMYPDEKYHRLYLGRSPVPLAALDQALSPDSVSNIPYSGSLEVTVERKDKVFKMLNKFLPKIDKKIVIIDFISTGKGIDSFLRFLLDYFETKGINQEIHALDLFHKNRTKVVEGVNWNRLNIDGSLAWLMAKERFEAVAEYGRFNPDKDMVPDPKVKNLLYKTLKVRFAQQVHAMDTFPFRDKAKNNLVDYINANEKVLRDLSLIDKDVRNIIYLFPEFLRSNTYEDAEAKLLMSFLSVLKRNYLHC